jgi:hypothetical protein
MQFSMSSAQPLFSGKLNENMEDWLFTAEINIKAAGIQDDRKVMVAAGYLRDNALQAFKQLQRGYGELSWSEFKKEFLKRFSITQTNEAIVESMRRSSTGNQPL